MNSDHELSDGEDDLFVSSHRSDAQNNKQVLVAIDCSESMFQPLESLNGLTGMQVALRALHNIYDEIILSKIKKNKLAVALFHQDPEKVILIDFDAPLISLFKTLKELAFSPAEKLEEYKSDGLKFSQFLIECTKKFQSVNKNDVKSLLYVTINGDPCRGDADEKFHALKVFQTFDENGIRFRPTPLVEDFDYEPFFNDAYSCVNEVKPKHFYNLEFLTELIRSTVKFKFLYTNIKLHLNAAEDCTARIPCLSRKYNKNAQIYPNKTMTRDLQTEARRTSERREDEKFILKVSQKIFEGELIISKNQREGLKKTPQIKQGLTIIHASKKRYSDLGVNLKPPALLLPKKPGDSSFLHLWEACVKNELNLLCYLKYTKLGKVHSAELVPQTVDYQKQFLLTVIPSASNSSIPNVEKPNVEYKSEVLDVFNKLIDEMTIKDYDVTKVRPYVYNRQVEYFKKELLGSDYVDEVQYTDFVEGKAYEGDVERVTEQLNLLFPVGMRKGKRGKKQKSWGLKRQRKLH